MGNAIANATPGTVAVVSDPLFLEHRAPEGHPERPERLAAAEKAVSSVANALPEPPRRAAEAPRRAAEAPRRAAKTIFQRLPARDASGDELGRVHTGAYLEALTRADGGRGYLDPDTYYTPLSTAAARRAAGGCVALVDALLDGAATTGLALVRPPGHHARPGTAMGFCLINNIAVAAAHARARGVARVAIVDWDVHHGNGTQEIFYSDPSVLFVSLHQSPFYPGTGKVEECGAGTGTGATINVPLSAGAGDAAYVAAFDRIVAPALSEFDPDLVLISAGFDAHIRDPLASMRVTDAGYAAMLRRIVTAMPRGPRGRLGIVLEGGYDLEGLEQSLHATLHALENPAPPAPQPTFDPIEPAHEADLARALGAAKRHHGSW